MGAATNQAAEEGYRVVGNGRISARNSAPGVGTSSQDAKKASRNLLSLLALQCRGAPRCTVVNEISGWRLALSVFPEVYDFSGDAVLGFVEPGLYRKPGKTSRATAPTLPDQQ